MFVVGIILYESRFPWKQYFIYIIGNEKIVERIVSLQTAIGSSILIICLFRLLLRKVFSNYVGSFLGKISYSLYLMHFPVLLLVFSCKFHWQICIFLSLFFQFYLPLEYIS